MTYYVSVLRDGGWTLVGQYGSLKQARLIEEDYRSHGEHARVTRDGEVEETEE